MPGLLRDCLLALAGVLAAVAVLLGVVIGVGELLGRLAFGG